VSDGGKNLIPKHKKTGCQGTQSFLSFAHSWRGVSRWQAVAFFKKNLQFFERNVLLLTSYTGSSINGGGCSH
jgi:hypothetical protein